MASTDYLKTVNAKIADLLDEGLRVSRELVRDNVLHPQSITDYVQMKEYLLWAQHNIVQDDIADEKRWKGQKQDAQ